MKKVLIVTYYWPPAGGPGVQRVLKFAKYLPEFDWQPIILTVRNGEYPAIDKSLLFDIPKPCRVYRTKSLEPFFFYKKLTGKEKDYKIPTYVLTKGANEQPGERFSKWMRANFFIPDAKIGWLPFAVREGLKIIEKENINLILSSSPPHSVQLIGSKLAKKSGLKWVADFRDPWCDAFWIQDLPKLSLVKKLEKRLEESVLKKANVIVSVSKSLAELFAQKAPNNYQIITNGYDEDDYKNIPARKDFTKFRIIYTGYMAASQNPINFFQAIKNIDKSIAAKIEVIIWGKIHDAILKTIMDLNIQEKITLQDYVSHEEIIQHIFNSDMLLMIIPKTERSEHIVTGKIFEYIRANKFILGIGNKRGDAAEILFSTKCGAMFDFNEPLHDIIVRRFNAWQDKVPMQVNHQEIEKYARKNLTKKLVEIFAMVEQR